MNATVEDLLNIIGKQTVELEILRRQNSEGNAELAKVNEELSKLKGQEKDNSKKEK